MQPRYQHGASYFVAGCRAKLLLFFKIDWRSDSNSQPPVDAVATDVRQWRMLVVRFVALANALVLTYQKKGLLASVMTGGVPRWLIKVFAEQRQ
jgi:hypothetical protein